MKKKLLYFSAMLVSFISFLATSVFAAGKGIGGILGSMLEEGGLFHFILVKLPATDAGARLVFGLLILTILYGVAQLVLGRYSKNLRLMISIMMAIIASVAMPQALLTQISFLWGGIFYAIFIGIPVLGGFYLLFTTFKEPTRGNYAIKMGITGILLYVCNFLTGSAEGKILGVAYTGKDVPPVGANLEVFNFFSSALGILGAIAAILFIYYVVKTIAPAEGPTLERVGHGLSSAMPTSVGRRLRRLGRSAYRADRMTEREIKQLTDDVTLLKSTTPTITATRAGFPQDVKKILTTLQPIRSRLNANTINEIKRKTENAVIDMYTWAKQIGDKKLIDDAEGAEADVKELKKELDAAETYFEGVSSKVETDAAGNRGWNVKTINSMDRELNSAVSSYENAIKKLKEIETLERDIIKKAGTKKIELRP